MKDSSKRKRDSIVRQTALATEYLQERLATKLGLREVKPIRRRRLFTLFKADSDQGWVAIKVYAGARAFQARQYAGLLPLIESINPPELLDSDPGGNDATSREFSSLTWRWIDGGTPDLTQRELRVQLISGLAGMHSRFRETESCWRAFIPLRGEIRTSSGEEIGLNPAGQDFHAMEWDREHFVCRAAKAIGDLSEYADDKNRNGLQSVSSQIVSMIDAIYDASPLRSPRHGDLHRKNMILDNEGTIRLLDFDHAAYAPFPLELASLLVYLRKFSQPDFPDVLRARSIDLGEVDDNEAVYLDLAEAEARDIWKECREAALALALLLQAKREFRSLRLRRRRRSVGRKAYEHELRELFAAVLEAYGQ